MSNFLILLPNLIVLMVTGFDKGKNLGFIAFLFPGSGLLGIILNEKNDLQFFVKMFFMLICSYIYLLLSYVIKKLKSVRGKVP